MKTMNWALPLASLAAYAVLLGYLTPQLAAQSDGALPFDLRPLGYALADARAYLGSLTPAGAALYLGPMRLNDTVVPILFTATLCLPLRRMNQLWFLPALAYGLCDLSENIAVARLLRAGSDVEAGAVALASGFTQAKFAALAVAVLVAVYGLWRGGWR